MSYNIITLDRFIKQVSKLNKEDKKRVYDKIQLIKENPFRFKHIKSDSYPHTFRVCLSIQRKETKLIYVIIKPDIILVCLMDRKKEYKDLENNLKKINLKKK